MTRKLFASTFSTALALLLVAASVVAAANRVPTVTAFDVAANSASPVPVPTFTATDTDGTVTGYLITESSVKPAATAPGWSATAPREYATASIGTITLYAWAKDNANAVSTTLKSDTVIIPPPPINADTLDGKHASEFALAAHNHDAEYQKKYANIAVVAKSGGDYNDAISALGNIEQWCGVPSPTNPCLLKIMPGVFDVGSQMISMLEYVDIEGSGENTTVISGSGVLAVVAGENNSEIRFLTVQSAGGGIYNDGSSPKMTNVTIKSTGIGIHNHFSAGVVMSDVAVYVSGACTGIYNYSSSAKMDNINVSDACVGEMFSYGIRNWFSTVDMTNVTANASGADQVNWAVRNDGGSVAINDSRFSSLGTVGQNAGVSNSWQATVKLNNVTAIAQNGWNNWGMYNPGQSDTQIDRSTFEGTSGSIVMENSAYGSLKVGCSKLVGPFVPALTTTCVGSYNGNYAPLDATCK